MKHIKYNISETLEVIKETKSKNTIMTKAIGMVKGQIKFWNKHGVPENWKDQMNRILDESLHIVARVHPFDIKHFVRFGRGGSHFWLSQKVGNEWERVVICY